MGEEFKDGGFHPRFGTRNNILPCSGPATSRWPRCLTIPSPRRPSTARHAGPLRAGRWLSRLGDLGGRPGTLRGTPRPRRRARFAPFPDGRELKWSRSAPRPDERPQLPYFVKWESPADVLPSALPGDIALASLEIAGSRQRIEDWMGEALPDVFDGVNIEFTSPNAHPGINAAIFSTPERGLVRI
ncbi:VOC family protein [Propionibacterium freudenreichii]|nr:VOC family protein [Propionibacterium freudenreichii]